MMGHARRRGRRRGRGDTVAFACASIGIAGCTAILGDFASESTGPGGSVSLLVDGAAREGDGAPEGGAAGDATPSGPTDGPSPLTCATWLYARPIVLEVLSAGNRRISGTVDILSDGTTGARVIAGKASTGVPFSVYGIDKSQSTPQVTQLDAPSMPGGEFATLRRVADGATPSTAVVTYAGAAEESGALAAFSAYVLPDAVSASGPLPVPFVVYRETPIFPDVDTIRVLPLFTAAATSDAAPPYTLFTAVTYPSPSQPVAHVLGVGQATAGVSGQPATLYTVVTTPNLGDVKDSRLLQAGDSVYIYDENDPSSPGLSAWKVPATAAVTTPPPRRAVSTGMPARVLDVANGADGAEFAYEADTVSGAYTTSIRYLAGTVPNDNLDTWASTDLQSVATFANVFTAPTGIPCGSVWTNDNLMLLGPGLRNASEEGGVAPGLNLLWFDATGTLRSSGSGTNGLLTDRDDFTNVAASPAEIGAASARWDIVWVETKSDDAGLYDTVLYDELDCQ